jgi:hypothetical protein
MPDPGPAGLSFVDVHQMLFRAFYGFPARMNAGIPLPGTLNGSPSPQLPPAAAIVEELGLW